MAKSKWMGFASIAWLALVTHSLAQPPSAFRWETDLEAAKKLAAQSNRLVLVHFWATWCPPCLRLEEQVFSKPAFAASMASQYVCVKLDYDQNQNIAQQFAVREFPTDIILSPQGQVVQRMQSPPSLEQYLGAMQQIAMQSKQKGPAAPPTAMASDTPPAAAVGATTGKMAALSDDRYADYFSGNQTPAAAPAVSSSASVGAPSSAGGSTYSPGAAAAPGAAATGLAASRGWSQPSANAPSGATSTPGASGMSMPNQGPPTSMSPAMAPAANNLATSPPSAGMTNPSAPPGLTPGAGQPGSLTSRPPVAPPPANVAAAPANVAVQLPPGSPPLGLDGYCPVTLVEKQGWKRGDVRFGAIHRNRTYLFTSAAEQQKFLANPDSYSPVMSGDDPVLALDQNRAVAGMRKHGVFYGNRIYLFSSEQTLAEFSRNPTRYSPEITQARR